jgi:hypothetical protein
METDMKKLVFVIMLLSVFALSNFAMASVHGTWNVESIEKTILKIGSAKPVTDFENIQDVWSFRDDNSFASAFFSGTWSQKGASFTIVVAPEQVRVFIEGKFLAEGMPASVTIKKLRIYGSEKKNQTIKGKYEIKADLVFPGPFTGKLDIKGSFTGTLPYNAGEYFPLGQGDTWTYHEIEQEGQEVEEDIETYAIMGTEKIKGKFAAKKVAVDDGDYQLVTNTNGIQFYMDYETETENNIVVESIDTYNPPIMYLPPRISVGTRHSFKSTLTHKESTGVKITAKITGNAVVEGIETITVAHGTLTFQNCLKIRINRHVVVPKLQYEEITEAVMWFAPGVGMVKEMSTDTEFSGGVLVEENSDESELMSATVGGIPYPAIP